MARYQKICPRCGAFYAAVWKRCTECGVPLHSRWILSLLRGLVILGCLALLAGLIASARPRAEDGLRSAKNENAAPLRRTGGFLPASETV